MTNRLYRSRYDRKVAGVCGGIAHYFDIDPSLVRIMFVLLAFFNGFGFLAYIVCWIVLPEQPDELERVPSEPPSEAVQVSPSASFETSTPATKQWATGLGILLVAIGFAILIERLIPWLKFGDLVPYLLIVGGILLLYRGWSQTRTARKGSSLEETSDAT